MALYHGVENDVEFVSSRPTSRDLSPTLEDADLEEVLMGYPNISQAPFANLVAFKRTFMTCLRSLVEHMNLLVCLKGSCRIYVFMNQM
ncbi:hypothetical protein CY35_07G099200 [Sphagnum magellanicum]|nr:hypothetical protein CY35_07G099200 [Sphagnum magellanicum]